MTRLAIALFSLSLGGCAEDDPVVDDTVEQTPAPPETAVQAATRAAAHVHLVGAVPELAPADLGFVRASTDELGRTHVRHQQQLGGIPVLGGEAIVHLDDNGALHGITDDLVRDLDVDTTPTLSSDDAIARALDATGGDLGLSDEPTAELAISRADDGDHLVWRVAIERLASDDAAAWSKPMVLVDAATGAIVRQWERIVDADATGTGTGRYVGNVQIRTWSEPGGPFHLEQLSRRIAVATLQGRAQDGNVERITDTDNVWTGDSTAVAAYWALGRTWDYYQTTFTRNGIDGSNGPGYLLAKAGGKHQTALVHWGNQENNAKWVNPQMVFGDGDGTRFSPLVELDIVAHEWTHGITSSESQLGHDGESPALNEHLSDAFAAAVDAATFNGARSATWKIGEISFTPGTSGDALRYLNDPALDGTSLDYWTSSLDASDPHDGAGVGNLAFYLVSQGGGHPRRSGTAHVTGVGIGNAQRIWYQAMTTGLTSTAEYRELRTATLQAAADLYGAGGSSYRAVHSAWEAVGLPQVTVPGFASTVNSSLASGGSAQQPSFLSDDGSVVGMIGHDQDDDFDLELWTYDWTLSAWKKVRSAVGPGGNEIIAYSAGAAAWYFWRVVATSGSGSYSLGWNP